MYFIDRHQSKTPSTAVKILPYSNRMKKFLNLEHMVLMERYQGLVTDILSYLMNNLIFISSQIISNTII